MNFTSPEGCTLFSGRLRRLLLAWCLLGAGACLAQPVPGALWIDVRTPGEYAEDHLPQAISIPYDKIEVGVEALHLPSDAPIYLYCAAGGRAEKAKQSLQVRGYTNVTNVGGLKDAQLLVDGAQPPGSPQ